MKMFYWDASDEYRKLPIEKWDKMMIGYFILNINP